jgi:hypothetical protein
VGTNSLGELMKVNENDHKT